jgi:4,5-DOPA dioxygenase extradiol
MRAAHTEMTAPAKVSASAQMTAPALFISHGAPTFALEPGELGARLAEIGPALDTVRAVLVVSPHWQTRGLVVSAAPQPETLHDFGGFPEPLYALRYPAPGAPKVAQEVVEVLCAADWPVTIDAHRGLDHGAWVPLLHLRPQADLPVLQLSMPVSLDAAAALALGQALRPLRDRGIALVGSGSMTHNLGEFRGPGLPERPYVRAFTQWMHERVIARDLQALADYRSLAPSAARAHPSDEHLLPLQVAVGATSHDEPVALLATEIRYGMLAMASYAWGLGR